MTVTGEQSAETRKRRINDMIRESLESLPSSTPIGFFCECTSPTCFTTVWLSGDRYDVGRDDATWSPLASGHALSVPAE